MLRYLKFSLVAIIVTVVVVTMRIGLILPYLKKKIVKSFTDLSLLEDEELEGCILHWKMLTETVRQFYLDVFKEARLGKDAPDAKLVPIRRKQTDQEENNAKSTCLNLSELMEPGTPLVVTFGSCSCPPFYRKLKSFGELAHLNAGLANFIVIYIEEAHPTDGWVFKDKTIQIAKHQKMDDRVEAAGILLDVLQPDVDIYADLMDNKANHAYAGFPERLYVLMDGKIEYQGGIGPFLYDIGEVKNWLDNYRQNIDSRNFNA